MPPSPHPLPHPATTAPAGAVLITGASTGIGAAAAVALAERGYFVFGGVRSPAAGVALVAACGGPSRAAALPLDVTDPASINAATLAIAAALESGGGGGVGGGDSSSSEEGAEKQATPRPPRRLAALVNNAGVSLPGPLLAQPAAEVEATLAVNLVGALAITRAVGPLLGIPDAAGVPGLGPAWRRAGGGGPKGTLSPLPPLPPLAPPTAGRGRPVIVNISSVAGKVAGPYMGAYAASKHGLEGASDALRREVAPFGVEVVVLGEKKRGGGGGRFFLSFFSHTHTHAHTPTNGPAVSPSHVLSTSFSSQSWAPSRPRFGRKPTPSTWPPTPAQPGRPPWRPSCA